ncbi:OmpH family outer membrane protein [Pontibacter sp. BT310]|uniref:OmpH family outer membrane protein n=1 Tax=Pontibacter populi TaxID=890055 RepID=A0ABS6XFN4_9BACT|nr:MULTISPECIES: OmpH family outer membrane protein [Pontibacter]MBJ6119950.1 OmpH family outer membrane protein [Pontibacter sp. BT310]MBR0572379.1 OmpH family outer membrane protein [Microvirga sp. STS03]MBW3366803.1 OmpH family outer membrane protein [Pontibacter populi]
MMNKIKTLVVAFLLISFASFAQSSDQPLKIGYTNVEYILLQLPESKQIESSLKDHSTQLENQLKGKYADYESKLQAYEKGAATMDKTIREDKEKELMNLNTSIQEFQRNAQQSLQQKEKSLVDPVIAKIDKAIKDVAKENGYTYVISNQALLAGPEDGDISPLVLKKLGVDPTKVKATPEPAAAKPATTPAKAPAKTPAKSNNKKKN